MTPLPTTSGPPTETSFPRLSARTARFTLGTPRVVGFARAGATLVFLRSRSGTDRTGLLWALDLGTGAESLLADPADVLAGGREELSAAELSRRERSREGGAGIVSAALDATGDSVVFALSSRLFRLALHPSGAAGTPVELPAGTPVIDPRPDPTGRLVAYASDGALHLSAADGSGDRVLLADADDAVSWGVAEFVAAEEIGRRRGYWWAPDGSALLVARVDESPVAVRVVSDPAKPREPAREERYPFAGTANAEVTLWWVAAGPAGAPTDGAVPVRVDWDTAAFPYLTSVSWTAAGPPLIAVQSRDQREGRVYALDVPSAMTSTDATDGPAADAATTVAGVDTVATREVARDTDPSWLELVPGVPAWAPGGRLLTVVADTATDTYRLAVDGVPVGPAGVQVTAVLDVGPDDVLVTVQDDPVTTDVATLALDGTLIHLTGPHAGPGSPASTGGPGVHTAARAEGSVAIARSGLEQVPTTVVVRRTGDPEVHVRSLAVAPPGVPAPQLLELGPHRLRAWLLLPPAGAVLDPSAARGNGDDGPAGGPGAGSVPVLLDPYGGPGAAMVVASARRLLEARWWADQGFAVLVTDGRGTPGRGPAFDRAVRHDFAGVTLDDQVEALHAVAALHPELDLSRVAMRGWSFGGYLSALAVLRRPDVFAAAVAGAPPTDWHLYDTHYTERYLGHPDEPGEVYRRNGLLHLAPSLERPLMIIHGLADDNVLVAHSLALSEALLEAGRPHVFLPLSGITHMATAETVAENLLLLQLRFLRDSLRDSRRDSRRDSLRDGLPDTPGATPRDS